MNKITIIIETDNAAFDPCPGMELDRILSDLAIKINWGEIPDTLFDINGNPVGKVVIE